MLPDVRVTILDSIASTVLKLDASGEVGGAGGAIQYEDTPSGNGAGVIPFSLSYAKVFGRGYWRGRNVVEISEADNLLTQALTTNLWTNSDSLSSATLTGLTLATGGPGGAADGEYTGTSSVTTAAKVLSQAFSTTVGQPYSLSAFIDPSNIYASAGGPTLNPGDKGTNTSLSGGNLVQTVAATGAFSAVRGMLGLSSGKWYFEVGVNSIGSGGANEVIIGLGTAAANINNYVGADGNGYGYDSTGGRKQHGGSAASYGTAFTTGAQIGVLADLDNGTLGFTLGGISQGTAFTGLSGTFFPMLSGGGNAVLTARFDANTFAFAPPTGYSPLPKAFLQLADGSGNILTRYPLAATDVTAKRYAAPAWTATVTSVVASVQLVAGAIVSSGQLFKVSQPMLEQTATASAWYVPSGTSTRLYLDANDGFDTGKGEDTQQAYLWDGATLTMRIPITGVGVDAASGQPYVTASAPLAGGGNPLSIGSYGSGTYVGRRRYCGFMLKRHRPNDKLPNGYMSTIGLGVALSQCNDTFVVSTLDSGTAIYNCINKNASRYPFLNISAGNFPTVGGNYSGSKIAVMVSDMVSDILATIPTGDVWCIRIGHDRTPRLIKAYTLSTNTYAYNRTLPQGVTAFEPLNFVNDDEDVSNLFNAIMVIGDTDPVTNQPVSATMLDTASIAYYQCQIDANPITKTGLKTVADCRNMALSLLNQSSLASSKLQLRVYTRNDGASVTNRPAGLTNGDVIRGIENLIVTRFSDTGSVLNLVPDSDLQYTSGLTALWTLSGMTVGAVSGPGGVPAFLSPAGSGAPVGNEYAYCGVIDVAPGQVMTLGGWVAAGGASAGSPSWSIWDPAMTTEYKRAPQTAGVTGRVTPVQWTVPNGVFQVVIVAHTNNCTVNSSSNVAFAQPEFDVGTTAAPYVANTAAPNVFGLVSSVVTTIKDTDRWQDVKFAAIEPDWNSAMAQQANQLANQILNNTQKPAQIASYIVSSDAFPPTGIPSTLLVVNPPTFLALFAANSSVVSVTGATFTLVANATNWAWLNSSGTWTIKQDPSPVTAAILYAIFQTDATHVIGALPRAPVGVIKSIPTGALPKMPVGTTLGVSAVTISSTYLGAGGGAVIATVTYTPTVTPPGGDPRPFSDWGAGYLYWAKVNDTGTSDGDTNVLNYVPCGALAQNTSGSSITDKFGPLGAGHAYQLAIQLVDQQNNGGPLAIVGLTAKQTIDNTSGTKMPSGLLASGPTITTASVTSLSTNKLGLMRNVTVSMTESDFTSTLPGWVNEIKYYSRVNGDTGAGPVQGSIDPRASTSGVYTFQVPFFTGANSDFGWSYTDQAGQESAINWALLNQGDGRGSIFDSSGNQAHARASTGTQLAISSAGDITGSARFFTNMPNQVVALADVALQYVTTSTSYSVWLTNLAATTTVDGSGHITANPPQWIMGDASQTVYDMGTVSNSGFGSANTGFDSGHPLYTASGIGTGWKRWYIITWTPSGPHGGTLTGTEFTSEPTQAQKAAAFKDGSFLCICTVSGSASSGIINGSSGSGGFKGGGGKVPPGL